MDNLPETPGWEAAIKQLEQDDIAEGGRNGIANLQATQLANRTQYLRHVVESVKQEIQLLSEASLVAMDIYDSVESAQKAIDSGTETRHYFSVRSSSNVWAERFANVSGVAVATGETLLSGTYIHEILFNAVLRSVRLLPDNGLLPGVSNYPFEVTSDAGEVAFGVSEKGDLIAPAGFSNLLGTKMHLIPPESDYLFLVDDEFGNIPFGVGKSGFIDILGMRLEASDIDNILEVIDGHGAIATGINRNGELLSPLGHPPVTSPEPKDFPERFHIPIYGQSLSVGALGSPILNTPTPESLMYNTGVISRGKSPISLVPLAENGVETIASALANSFVSNVKYGMNGRKLILNSGGVGGEKIANLSKGKPAYNDLINQIKWCSQYNISDGREYAVDYIVWIQGEADANLGMSKEEYKARLSQLRIDIENDLSAVRNTARQLQMMIYQMSSHGFYAGTVEHPSVEIPIAHLELSNEDENIHCFGPNYMFAGSDQVHKTNHGYRQMGLQAEKAIRHHLETGEKFRPLEPIKFRKITDRVIIGDFYVPVPPMKFDDSIVSQLPDGNNGFEVWDSSGRVGIVNTEVIGSSQLKITTGRALVGEIYVSAAYTPDNRGEATNGWYNSWYAGPKTGVRTTLRDSDTTSTELIGLDGKVYPRQNYCVIFKMRCEK
ncbi:sialate O-acetylesterase [Serratia fonticola]|uniref:sialate O-acetylesterase n=1 Tax=Serratia fonticola TaxID=47917 RepID=UPI003AADA232